MATAITQNFHSKFACDWSGKATGICSLPSLTTGKNWKSLFDLSLTLFSSENHSSSSRSSSRNGAACTQETVPASPIVSCNIGIPSVVKRQQSTKYRLPVNAGVSRVSLIFQSRKRQDRDGKNVKQTRSRTGLSSFVYSAASRETFQHIRYLPSVAEGTRSPLATAALKR